MRGHGVQTEAIQQCWEQTEEFFALPLEVKAADTAMTADYPYGYLPLGAETLAAGKAQETGADDCGAAIYAGRRAPLGALPFPVCPLPRAHAPHCSLPPGDEAVNPADLNESFSIGPPTTEFGACTPKRSNGWPSQFRTAAADALNQAVRFIGAPPTKWPAADPAFEAARLASAAALPLCPATAPCHGRNGMASVRCCNPRAVLAK